ncbi:hypothetical protein [Bradyrhizobium sp. STM 3562]|uniref:hypothetical protein n=1 Tax=Bradyrhizobium sp. STM 3562 TaxID=578924 RepID=UPI00388EAF0D
MDDTINWAFLKRHFSGELLRHQQPCCGYMIPRCSEGAIVVGKCRAPFHRMEQLPEIAIDAVRCWSRRGISSFLHDQGFR